MNQLHCWISFLGLLLCLIVYTCRATNVHGFEGQDVILPCKYDSHYNGVCDVCWMIGSIPTNGCGTQIIYASGKEVVMRESARYQLNGALQWGDASLTILNARKSDSGKYGCRVHVPGWFNDEKFEVYLDIREATTTTTTTTTTEYVTTTTHIPTHEPLSSTQHETTIVPEHISTIPTGPVLTTQDESTPATDQESTKHTETEQTFSTLEYVTAITTHIDTQGPVLTTQDEKTTALEHMTTKETAVISENYPNAPSSEHDKLVSKGRDMLIAILVPVILILLILGIFAVSLIYKHKRRLRTTLEIAKNSSASVSYSNLDNNVNLPMTNSSNN